MVLSVGNQHGDQGLVLSVGRKTWAGSICANGDQGLVPSVGMETRALFFLWVGRPGLSSICAHGDQGLVPSVGMETRAWFFLSLRAISSWF